MEHNDLRGNKLGSWDLVGALSPSCLRQQYNICDDSSLPKRVPLEEEDKGTLPSLTEQVPVEDTGTTSTLQ